MRGFSKATGLIGAGALGAGPGFMVLRYYRQATPPAPASPPPPSPLPITAREKIIAIFPSLALGERVSISGEEARDSTRGYGAEVYAVYVYYHVDAGQNNRRCTMLSTITRSFEVRDWRAVEKVEVLLNKGGQVDFLLEDGIVIG